MRISEIISKVNQIRPSKEELVKRIEDSDYVEYLLDSYVIDVDNVDPKLSLIENLVLHTSFGNIDFAGITFNNSLDEIEVDGTRLRVFAMFQENQICSNESFDQFYYVDLYDPNNQPIIVQCDLIQDKFIDALLVLMEMDIKFTYKDKFLKPNSSKDLARIAGHPDYENFFNIVLSQFE